MDKVLLVKRIRDDDRKAFNELYKQLYFPARSYARLFVNESEVEDLIQDVFVNLWIHRKTLDESLSIQAYLMRSIHNTALNKLKHQGTQAKFNHTHRQEIEEIGYRFYNPDTNDTLKKLYNQDLRRELNKAIKALPPKCRKAFTLNFVNKMTAKEISQKLGVSQSTIENHIHNALKALRKALKTNNRL